VRKLINWLGHHNISGRLGYHQIQGILAGSIPAILNVSIFGEVIEIRTHRVKYKYYIERLKEVMD
jgi:hypothetical protein